MASPRIFYNIKMGDHIGSPLQMRWKYTHNFEFFNAPVGATLRGRPSDEVENN